MKKSHMIYQTVSVGELTWLLRSFHLTETSKQRPRSQK